MNRYKKLIVWTLITNFLIVIAAGHGIATLGIMEGFVISNLFNYNSWKPTSEILLLFLSGLITIIGQVVLIISIFINSTVSSRLTSIGVFVLMLGCFFLLAHFWSEPTIGVSLFTSIPFVILAIILFFKSLSNKKEEEIQSV